MQCSRPQITVNDYRPICADADPARSPFSGSNAGKRYHTGPKGGIYYYNAKNNKQYVKRKPTAKTNTAGALR